MRKILAIATIILLTSCDSIFHDENNPYLKVDSYEEQIDLLNGIYSHIASIYTDDYFISMRRSDDLNIYNSFNIPGKCGNNVPGEDERVMHNIYQNSYIAIVNINRLLVQLTVEDDAEIMGELYFLRGYLYFMLARFFGKPPLIDDYYINYLVEKPSYKEVYEFIEGDLLVSIDLLPDNYSTARIPKETPHKGMAKALLAEVYLCMGGYPVNEPEYYKLAAKYAGEVIDSAEYYDFQLVADLDELWRDDKEHCAENIFGIFIGSEPYSFSSNLGGFYNLSFWGGDYISLESKYHPGFYFIDHFPDGYRKIRSLTKGYYVTTQVNTFEDNQDPLSVLNNEYIYYELYDPINDPCRLINGAAFTKWYDLERLKRHQTGQMTSFIDRRYFTDIYLLRYAQTLLTYAEAKARSGELDADAYDAVNKIRRRANNVPIDQPSAFDLKDLTTTAFIDSVVWERAWELCFEPNGRWFDIIRLDLRLVIEDNKYPNDAADVVDEELLTDDWYFFLIPQEDRWVNPNY